MRPEAESNPARRVQMLWLALGTYGVLLVINLASRLVDDLSFLDLRVAETVLACVGLITFALTARWNALPVLRAFALPENLGLRRVGIIVLGMAAGLVAANLLDLAFPTSDATTMVAYRAEGSTLAMALLDMSVIAPLFEEVAFRGIVLGALLGPLSRSGALWTSSLMFATLHLTPLTFVHHTVLGLTCGYARLETRSIILPILIHATYNAIVVTMAW